ncbi:damage-inducible protein DinB [Bacillus sp. FJAT-27225]|uniref:DinB family protein n=1 Tax=Bacillus sp. FJAT-27225 TaxID=1743144 RepID=UPI00080C2527|nr:DinB family protein [Bacillus sp. FJAT-27225]OCA85699.1 damage-inducible protein DinB [Bacillus sp. FJAT-27225]
MISRPEPREYNPYYAPYIRLIADGDLVKILERQAEETRILLKGLSERQAEFRYAKGKWSIKEVLGHIADTERIMAYRLLVIARADLVELPGFDENEYVKQAGFDKYPFPDLLGNFLAVRASTLTLVKALDDSIWEREGVANGGNVSARALVSIIAGHELHHRKIIMERYIGSGGFPQW